MPSLLMSINQYFGSVPNSLRPKRWSIIIFVILATIGLSVSLFTRFELDATFDSWFEDDDPIIEALDDFRRQFGSDDGMFLVYEALDGDVFSHQSLTAIRELTEQFENRLIRTEEGFEALSHIKRVQSLANVRVQYNDVDTLRSERLVPKSIPTDIASLNAIKARANDAENLKLFMFSDNHRYGALMIQTDFGTIPKTESMLVQNLDDSLEFDGSADFDFDLGGDDYNSDELAFDDSIELPEVEFEDTDSSAYIGFSASINKVISQETYTNHFNFYPTGTAAMVDLSMETMEQAGILLLLMVLIVVGLLWTLFHSASAVVWSLLAIIISILWVVGGTLWMGYAVSQLISLTVMLILAVGVADCVHVMSTYIFYRREGKEHEIALSVTYAKVGLPILLTTITTMAGMLALTITGMAQFQFFGIVSALGVLMAFLFTVYFLPILLDFWHPQDFKEKVPSKNKYVRVLLLPLTAIRFFNKKTGIHWLFSAKWLQPLLDRIPEFVQKRPITITALFMVLFVTCVVGMTKVRIDSNLVELFDEESSFSQAYNIVDKHMMGTGNMEIMINMGETDALMDPIVMQSIGRLQTTIEQKYSNYVVRTYSLADLVKETNKIMFDGDMAYSVIPDNAQAINQLLYLFNSANPEDRRALVSDDYSQSHISINLINAGSYEYSAFFEEIKEDIALTFDPLKNQYPDMDISVTGTLAMMMRLLDDLSVNQFKSLAFALLIISALMIVTLGSFQAGILGMIPNLIPATLTFGLMGWLGIPLDTDTLMIAPLIIGIAVDDTIHFITHYRMALAESQDMRKALHSAIKEVGQAVTFTTLILGCGFFMLTFSDYLGLAKMGGFGALAIFVALLCDLLLLPALIMIFKPKFGLKVAKDNFQGEFSK